ncbi:MAG TPA: FmdB family zinc ribbon protein [Candidatus Binatus sp.]|nr:FmdB family zinc ribbon protein [Candidatus Binatus sp.]
MPIYDYACSHCGRVTEVIHGINDQGPRFCPNCGAEGTMRKAMSAPAIVFKGSGWAKVDRRSSSGGGASRRSSTKPSPATDRGGASSPAGAGGAGSTAGGTGGATTPPAGDGGGD